MRSTVRAVTVALILAALTTGCGEQEKERAAPMDEQDTTGDVAATALATFGAGCFWCVEAVFEEIDGVTSVRSGYSGGQKENPTYEEVCSGSTGHAEVVQIAYDPARVSYEQLLQVFFQTHDPTTPNRQGADVGTQYRSAIFFHDDEQKETAERIKTALDLSGAFGAPIVTEIAPYDVFYAAEDYHQDFYASNPNHRYCAAVIQPKLEKFRKVFSEQLKTAE